MCVMNKEIRIRAVTEPINKQVARRRWTWLDHTSLEWIIIYILEFLSHGYQKAEGIEVDH